MINILKTNFIKICFNFFTHFKSSSYPYLITIYTQKINTHLKRSKRSWNLVQELHVPFERTQQNSMGPIHSN